MSVEYGTVPKGGFAKLVPELLVADLDDSLTFWCSMLGFEIAYQRPEGAQIMLCRRSGRWETGPLEQPFGRGVMFQVHIDAIQPVLERLEARSIALHAGPREVWRRLGDREGGQREIFVLDPNGYLIMLAEDLGERPLAGV